MNLNKNNNNTIDISKNIVDLCGNKNIFHNIFNLHYSKDNKSLFFNNIVNDVSDNIQLDIKNNSLLFSMKFNSILDDLRKNRIENEKKLKDNSFDIIKDSLDKTQDYKNILEYENKSNLQLIPYNKKLYRKKFNKILKNIDNKFKLTFEDDISKNIIKSSINKKNASTQYSNFLPPPPFPNNIFGGKDTLNPLLQNKDQSIWNTNSSWNDLNKPSISFTKPSNINIPMPATVGITIPPQINIKKSKVKIEREINGLADILKLIDDYPLKIDIEYNINMQAMHNIKKPLEDLDNMIGMHKLKDAIVDQIIFFSQNLHMGNDFMHTVIYGPPGTGKTEIAKIMGKIFSSIGILKNNKFRKATRADLIAGYLGQTAMKTRDVIKDCLGGVLFIDEAYALGNREKRDSFAKECIDTLCEGLSDNKDNLMVIIAGYEEDLDKCFFSYNQGLNSRFPWRFHTDDYKADELNKIFAKKVKEIGWSLEKEIKNKWFEDKMDYFKFYGRDIETLLAKTKIAHGRRVFCKDESEKRVITQKDINKGFEMFTDNKEVKNRVDKQSFIPFMYA